MSAGVCCYSIAPPQPSDYGPGLGKPLPQGATRNSLPGHCPSPSGLTFRSRFKVFAVRTIDTDSRVGREPGQLTTHELVSVSRTGGHYPGPRVIGTPQPVTAVAGELTS